MKLSQRFALFVWAVGSFPWAMQAMPESRSALVAERDALLSKIVSQIESRREMGLTNEDDLIAAKLALSVFRRESSADASHKVEHQREILALLEDKLRALKDRAKNGAADSLDVLKATDDVLAAKLVLQELLDSAP